MYSNTGIERAADELAAAAGHAVRGVPRRGRARAARHARRPSCSGSPAHGIWSTLDDIVRFVAEMRRPTLLAPDTARRRHSSAVPRARRYRSGRGPFRSVPLGTGGRAPWRQVAALDGSRQLGGDVRSLRRRRHDDVGRPARRRRRRRAHRPPVRRVERRRPATVAGVLRRRARRDRTAPRRASTDVPARRSCAVGDHRRRRAPARPLRLRRRQQRRRQPCRRDARRRAEGRHGDRPRSARSRSASPTSSSTCTAPTCSTIRRCGRGWSTCGRPRPTRPGSRSGRSSTSVPACATRSSDGFALAELHSGGRQYVLRAICEGHNDVVCVRADPPRRWES